MNKSTCSIEDCEGRATRRGWCDKHYRRWRAHGDPSKVIHPKDAKRKPKIKSTCIAPECGREARSKGACAKHRTRYLRTGRFDDPVNVQSVGECEVEGCGGITGVKGTARGFCSKHYNRWRRNGDSQVRTQRAIITHCTIDGCSKPHDAKGLCTAHITNLRRHGTPHIRKRGEIIDGKKICSGCLVDLPVDQYGKRPGGLQSLCKPCLSAYMKARRDSNIDAARKYELVQAKRHALYRRDQSRKRRAMKRATQVEQISSIQVMETASWVCGICSVGIPRVVLWPHPLSPSLDHVIPLALGGAHIYSNVQASHLHCNMRKGAQVDEALIA